jgi:PAS domain S-box-containing protein
MKTAEVVKRDTRTKPKPPTEAAARVASEEPVKAPLRVLIVEDREDDALLLELELEKSGYAPECRRVDSLPAMSEALAAQTWDLVIADYRIPGFGGLEALELVKSKGLDLPFIIVSGVITDHEAVAAMKAGAHDYIMKGNWARLSPAVRRELREAQSRRERRRTFEILQAEQVFRQAIENSVPSGIAAVDLKGVQTYVNPAFCELVGWSETDLVGCEPPFVYWPPENREAIVEALGNVVSAAVPAGSLELQFRRSSEERISVLLQVTPLKDVHGNITGWVSSASDITERKRAENRLAAEHAITRHLAAAASLDEAGPGILQTLLDSLEGTLAVLWRETEPGKLRPGVIRLREGTPELVPFVKASQRLELAPGAGLAGRVWREGHALWAVDVLAELDADRREIAAKAGLQSAAAFPIQNAGNFFGVLELLTRRQMEADPALLNMVTAIGSEIGQFLQRRRAEEALRRALDELEVRVQQRTSQLQAANTKLHASIAERKRLEHELLEITETERRRIGLDLHDDLGQKLAGIALMTKGLELELTHSKAKEATAATTIHTLVQEAMTHASGLARNLATLDPPAQELTATLEGLAAKARELFRISCKFNSKGSFPALEPSVTGQLYKIAQEALTNAIKHGKSKRVTILLENTGSQLVLTIQNDGAPFPALRSKSTGMGLRIMNYRAHLIGATLDVTGLGTRGTLVTCTLPI